MRVHRVRPGVSVLADSLEVPGIGHLPINAYVLQAEQPVVVDTGLSLPDRDFLETVGGVVDPADVRWIWLTHPDRDHTGGIFALLEAAPQAKVVTTFIGAGIMSTERPLPMDRIFLLNPGQALDVGDRTLYAFRPPLFDNPATVGFFDESTGVCFSSDCFGGPMPSEEIAQGADAQAVTTGDLADAQLLWASIDSPWVENVDREKFQDSFGTLREREPELVLSTHLPAAAGITKPMIDTLGSAAGMAPFVGPDQAALEAMLAGFER